MNSISFYHFFVALIFYFCNEEKSLSVLERSFFPPLFSQHLFSNSFRFSFFVFLPSPLGFTLPCAGFPLPSPPLPLPTPLSLFFFFPLHRSEGRRNAKREPAACIVVDKSCQRVRFWGRRSTRTSPTMSRWSCTPCWSSWTTPRPPPLTVRRSTNTSHPTTRRMRRTRKHLRHPARCASLLLSRLPPCSRACATAWTKHTACVASSSCRRCWRASQVSLLPLLLRQERVACCPAASPMRGRLLQQWCSQERPPLQASWTLYTSRRCTSRICTWRRRRALRRLRRRPPCGRVRARRAVDVERAASTTVPVAASRWQMKRKRHTLPSSCRRSIHDQQTLFSFFFLFYLCLHCIPNHFLFFFSSRSCSHRTCSCVDASV